MENRLRDTAQHQSAESGPVVRTDDDQAGLEFLRAPYDGPSRRIGEGFRAHGPLGESGFDDSLPLFGNCPRLGDGFQAAGARLFNLVSQPVWKFTRLSAGGENDVGDRQHETLDVRRESRQFEVRDGGPGAFG